MLAGVALFLTLRSGPVPLVPPAATGHEVALCAGLRSRLPDTLDGRSTRQVTPPSPLTTAWGRPAITLRCGLPPVAHPVSARLFCLGGSSDACAVSWYQDVFDSTLWVTRTAPRIAVRIPHADGIADVLGPITAAARG